MPPRAAPDMPEGRGPGALRAARTSRASTLLDIRAPPTCARPTWYPTRTVGSRPVRPRQLGGAVQGRARLLVVQTGGAKGRSGQGPDGMQGVRGSIPSAPPQVRGLIRPWPSPNSLALRSRFAHTIIATRVHVLVELDDPCSRPVGQEVREPALQSPGSCRLLRPGRLARSPEWVGTRVSRFSSVRRRITGPLAKERP